VCSVHNAPVAGQSYRKSPGNATTNAVIEQCKVCSSSEWANQTCTEDRNAQCTTHTTPEVGTTFVKTPGTDKADAVLQQCTTCSSNKTFTKTNCTATADRECQSCSACLTTQYVKGSDACTVDKDTKCSDAPSYKSLEVETGKDCKMLNGSAIGPDHYTSTSIWKFSIKAQGGAAALASAAEVTAPCTEANCAKKSGILDAQQAVVSGALAVPKQAHVSVQGSADGWCIKALCIASAESGAKAYKWSGLQWMNPGSDGPDAGGASQWTLPLTEQDSCAEATSTTESTSTAGAAEDSAAEDSAAEDSAADKNGDEVTELGNDKDPATDSDSIRSENEELSVLQKEIKSVTPIDDDTIELA